MRVSFTWLSELVDLPKGTTPAQVAEKLTAAGLEVEAIEDLGAAMRGVVVGKVVTCVPHPNAERLKLCSVDGGAGPVDVVCGASNVVAGATVLFATPGTVLPGGKRIEVAAVRGVTSNGMLCSAQELGLESTVDGLLLLPDNDAALVPGLSASTALGRDDVVLTLGVTPNRPDALSHLGVARELAAALRTRLKAQTPTCAERGGPVDDLASVTIEDLEGCPRYACRVIEGVVVGPSPRWLVNRLAACGVRSINNVVDVTNLVMMERGLPLHGFDCDKIARAKNRAAVVVRSARPNEKIVTLDGKERELVEADVVIADTAGENGRAIAIAGVMGGRDTEVSMTTTRVLLEGASFNARRVRRTARRLGLHSEASHRFERGCDPNGVQQALDRAAALIAELSSVASKDAARVARGVVDSYPKKIAPAVVTLRPRRAAALLGVPPKMVDEANSSKLLLSLGLEVEGREAEAVRFRVPTYRPDLTREVDLIEELLRLIGTDQIPNTLPARANEAESLFDTRRHRALQDARRALFAAGYDEAVNLAFTSPSALELIDGGDTARRITVRNPLGEEYSLLRNSLLPGLLQNAATNHRRGTFDVRLFESATVFLGRNPDGKSPRSDVREAAAGGDSFAREAPRLAGIASGHASDASFDHAATPIDFFDVKGHLEEMLQALGLSATIPHAQASFVPAGEKWGFLHPRARAELHVRIDGEHVLCGVVGEAHPDVVERFELKARPIVFELDLDVLARAARPLARAKPLARFPAVRRDFALVLDEKLPASALCARLAAHGVVAGLLEHIEIFDVYQGEHVARGKKSIAIALTLRAPDRTLTDDEVQKISTALLDDARLAFEAEVRA